MANMGYCRFQNTLQALEDCSTRLNDKLSPEEDEAREALIELCVSIAAEGGDTDLDEDS